MTCTLFVLLLLSVAIIGGAGAAGWFGGRRVVRHLQKNPEAAKRLAQAIAEDVIVPIMGDPSEGKPEPKKIKATLI
jgi:hypothetical protein